MNFETSVLHNQNKKERIIKSKVTPIYQTSAFAFSNLEELEGFYQGNGNYLYSRVGNPNTDELGQLVARLEGTPEGAAASSGLSAILAAILSIAQNGDHIVAADDVYGGTFHMLKEELSSLGISVTFVSFANPAEVEAAIQTNTVLLYTESITNPLLRVEDLTQLVQLAQKHELKTIVDNTFATPLHCQPYRLGVNIVVHSATKYIGGHSDVTAGVVVGDQELVERARTKIVNLGANSTPFEAWLTCRGAKTLALRMKAQSANARAVALSLKENEHVETVYYPLEHGEQGFGAMVTIKLAETVNISSFFKNLEWIKIVPTLAGVETSVSHPLRTSHRALPPEACAALGITDQVVRISIGIENAEDIIAVFNQAISKSI
ncbi:trans-sulfuration enzyme family protein [Cytobacillus gottheilii]|uniref:Aminotransferase class I/II-fold pyridoxal phosphate-dependent enzyme n=1 Tax=Cytobacillus gottheilii TaxID=859144 RepID=A0ABX8FD87_9BACI|nr:aminotransferase class I/II-fold pyridoxal phosphate-dependent enzyme [Cytobacillus gottheilii]QVY62266.1 aminotransferase class I/II-fold pyridoxal phosphate-dependent enzyme [Cytobacillus gottheilii]